MSEQASGYDEEEEEEGFSKNEFFLLLEKFKGGRWS